MIKKIFLGLLTLIVLLVGVVFIWIQSSYDATFDVEYPKLTISSDSAILARGEYLVNGPAHCTGCHVESIESVIANETGGSRPMIGGVPFPMGPLGTMYPGNLTPDKETGLGQYEIGQVFRMMRHAVKPNGTATLTPLMPFQGMADEDLIAVVSFLLAQPSIKNEVKEPEWSFLGKAIRTTAPAFKPNFEPQFSERAPIMEPTLERGRYLAHAVSNCVGCHTPRDQASFTPTGPEFSGGMEFEPWPELNKRLGVEEMMWTRSTNITPHPGSSFSKFKNLEQWIRRFRQGRLVKQSPMPWGAFSKMSDEDLEAIYIYLSSLDPVESEIVEVSFLKS